MWQDVSPTLVLILLVSIPLLSGLFLSRHLEKKRKRKRNKP